jgi:hypothetical protein
MTVIESERLRLLGFRMILVLEMACFALAVQVVSTFARSTLSLRSARSEVT